MSADRKIVCQNKKAAFDYFIDEVYEAGMVLIGPEVKSLREGRANLVDSYARVKGGEVFLYPTMARQLVQDYLSRARGHGTSDPSLSPRENEILKLLAEGYSSKEIAEKLVVSPSTVHTHRNNLMSKLGLSNRRELIQYARRRGLLRDF